MANNPAMMDPVGMQFQETEILPHTDLLQPFGGFTGFARGNVFTNTKERGDKRLAELEYMRAMEKAITAILEGPGGLSGMGGIVCNFGGGGEGVESPQNGDNNLDKPKGTMTLSQANKWAHIGNGEGVYIEFTKIILPGSVTVERFNKSDIKIDGSNAILVKFDGADFVNPNQALVYGTITLVLWTTTQFGRCQMIMILILKISKERFFVI